MTWRGGCKCGAVAFEAKGDPQKLMECNCSVCRPKAYLHWFVPEKDFKLERGEEALGSFKFNKHLLDHRFCRTCGVAPFVQGRGRWRSTPAAWRPSTSPPCRSRRSTARRSR